MATTFLYRCPNTRQTVQGWSAEDVSDDDEYQSIACLACAQAHLVNPKTGKVLGAEENAISSTTLGVAAALWSLRMIHSLRLKTNHQLMT